MDSRPTWVQDAVFYQIYPQSFCDANGDGVIDMLDFSIIANNWLGGTCGAKK